MPNHIANELEIEGTAEQVAEVKDFLSGKGMDGSEASMDFNNVVPMPETMDDKFIDQGTKDAAKEFAELLGKHIEDLPLVNSDASRLLLSFMTAGSVFNKETIMSMRNLPKLNRSHKEDVKDQWEALFTMINNVKEHGHAWWYDWCCFNWGSKWGAYDSSVEGDSICWYTAYSNSLTIVDQIAEKFPDVTFEYRYADETAGSNCGEVKYEGGVRSEENFPDEESAEAYELSFKLNEGEREFYRYDEDEGTYIYIED
jgi:hypothetical protein